MNNKKPVGLILRFEDELRMMRWVEKAQSPTEWGFMADHSPILAEMPVREMDGCHEVGKTYIMASFGVFPPLAIEITETEAVVTQSTEERK